MPITFLFYCKMNDLFLEFQRAFEAEITSKDDKIFQLQTQNAALKLKLDAVADQSHLDQISTLNEQLVQELNLKNAELLSFKSKLDAKDERMEAYADGLVKRICELDLKLKYSKNHDHEFNENQLIEKLRRENLKLFVKIGKLKDELKLQAKSDIQSSPPKNSPEPEILILNSPSKLDVAIPNSDLELSLKVRNSSSEPVNKPSPSNIIRKVDGTDSSSRKNIRMIRGTISNGQGPLLSRSHSSNSPGLPQISPNQRTNVPQTTSIPSKRNESPQQPFKYEEVVRKKHIRTQMHGIDCDCCTGYYKETKDLHPVDPTITAIYNDNNRVQEVSRHRVWSKRPDTPPGYWDVDFPSTQQIKSYQKRD